MDCCSCGLDIFPWCLFLGLCFGKIPGSVISDCLLMTQLPLECYWCTCPNTVVLDPDLLEQTSSQMYSKLHTAHKHIQIDIDLVTFVWSLNGQQELECEWKASTHYFVVYLTKNIETTGASTSFGALSSHPSPPTLPDHLKVLCSLRLS